MPASPNAELVALESLLDDLTTRVAALAHRLDGGATEGAAADLYNVERSLRAAGRRLQRARRTVG